MVLDPCMPVECVRCRDPALRAIVRFTIPVRVTNWKTQRGLQGGVLSAAGTPFLLAECKKKAHPKSWNWKSSMIGKAEEGCVRLTENVEAKQATRGNALAVVKQRRKAEVVLVRIV